MHKKRGRKGKKGQIAVWVILAIIIIAAGLLLYFLKPSLFRASFSKQKAQALLATQGENLRDAVKECIRKSVKYCLETVGKRGGYYYVADLWYADFAGPKYIVVYTDEEGNLVNKLPSLSKIVNGSLADCMNEEGWDQVDECVNFGAFKKYFDIKEISERKINIDVDDENVYVKVDWPMKLSKFTFTGTVEQTINQKEIELPIPLGRIWSIANDIVNMEIEGKEWANYADTYIQQHPYTLRYVDFRVQYYPSYLQTIFMLRSIPYRLNEDPFPFYFGIDREKRMGR